MSSIIPSNPALSHPPLDLRYDNRRLRFVGTAERPEWIAGDACDILDIVNVSRALADFDEDEKGIHTMNTIAGKQRLLTVYEPGLYKLIFKSRKPEAKKFQKWVFGEVLPSIRKYGIYPPPETFDFKITLKPYTARVVWVMHVRRALPNGYWCVFIEGAEILIGAEHILGPANLEMKQYDLLDASIGRHWSEFRFGKSWAGWRRQYDYTFPRGDPRGTVRPWCYPSQELPYFKEWLHSEYWTMHFPEYVKRKYGAKEFQRSLPIFAQLGVPLAANAKKKLTDGE